MELQEQRLPEFALDHGVVEFLVGGELLAFFTGKLREGASCNAFVDVQAERVDLRDAVLVPSAAARQLPRGTARLDPIRELLTINGLRVGADVGCMRRCRDEQGCR